MQKLVGTELYVFDLTPFEITQQTSDATVIFVQNECIDGYKELNASLADKIKGFNQFVICVTDPWAGGVEPSPEPPTPTGHTLTFDVQGITLCRITDELDSDAGEIDNPTSPVNVEVGKYFKMFTDGYGGDHYEYYTITGVQATFVDSTSSYNSIPFFYFVMPDEDVTLSVTYEEPVVSTHNIVISGGTNQLNICGYVNGEATWLEGTYDETTGTKTYTYAVGQPFEIDERDFTPTATDPQLETSEDPLWGVGTSYVMPDSDVAITVQAVAQPIEVAFTGDALNDGLTFHPDYAWDPTATYTAGAMFVLNCDSGKTTSDFTYSSTDANIVITDCADHFDIVFNASGTATFNKAEDPQL